LKHLLKNVDPAREKDDNNNGDEKWNVLTAIE
jgi:hypothetical protein